MGYTATQITYLRASLLVQMPRLQARRYIYSAVFARAVYVRCMSARPSVTLVYCIETAKFTSKLFSSSVAALSFYFSHRRSDCEIPTGSPPTGAQIEVW